MTTDPLETLARVEVDYNTGRFFSSCLLCPWTSAKALDEDEPTNAMRDHFLAEHPEEIYSYMREMGWEVP